MNNNDIKAYMQANLLTKKEAIEITGQSLSAFDQSINTGKIIPFFDKGEDRSRVRLYLKSDVEAYAEQIKEYKKRFKKD